MTQKSGLKTNSDPLRSIRYTSRDFQQLKNLMNQYLISYFPNSGSDFSEGSGAQAIIELIAYVGDVENLYLDKTFNETLLKRAFDKQNVYDLALDKGYQPRQVSPSVADIAFSFDLPVTGSLTSQFFFNISKGAQFKASKPGITFENLEPIIFNNETVSNFQTSIVNRTDGITVTRYSLSGIKVISGQTDEFQKSIGDPKTFQKIHIPRPDVSDVLQVTDTDGNEWFQVKNLSQEFVFTGIPNIGTDGTDVPFLLTVRRVPRRYTVTYDPDGGVDITFGSGEIDLTDSEITLSNPENIIFPNKTHGRFLDFTAESIQLLDFLNTTSLGVAPTNTTMIIKYRWGGGVGHNVGSNSIDKVENIDVQFYSILLNSLVRQFVIDSIIVNNDEASQGGDNPETIDQIRVNASYWYAAQDRVVSVQDYIARACAMPTQYGSVYKIMAQHAKNESYANIQQIAEKAQALVDQRNSGLQDQLLASEIRNLTESIKNNNADVKLYIVTKDSDGHLAKPTTNLKRNISTYLSQFKVASDTLEIDDISIINLGCRFEIHTDNRNFNPSEVLLNAMQLLQNYFVLDNMEIGKNINIDDIRKELRLMTGVISTPELTFFTINGLVDGRQYSNDYNFPIDNFLSYNQTIIECPTNAIFEVKFLKNDILGRYAE